MAWTERYCRADAAGSGDGTTDTNSGATGAWTLAEAILNVTAGTRVNVRGSSGTFSNGATARTFNIAGTAIAPIWWRGYNTTIGDLDNDFVTAKPSITFGNALCSFTGAKNLFSNLAISGARSSGTLVSVANEVHFKRCRIENTATQAACTAQTTGGSVFTDCAFKVPAATARVFQGSIATGFKKCLFEGGVLGLDSTASVNFVIGCVFVSQSSHGFLSTGALRLVVSDCTFKGCGGDGLRTTVAPATGSVITRCLFDGCTGWGINQISGTNTDTVMLDENAFYVGGGSGTITGFGDKPDLGEVTESSSPAVSSTDPTISATTFNSASVARPFESKTWVGGYYDAGAVQRQVTAGGGGSGTAILAGAGIGLVGGV